MHQTTWYKITIKHSIIKEQPSYIHFCDKTQRDCNEALKRTYQELQHIDEKMNALVLNQITPYSIGNAIRVVSYLDPVMTRKEQFVAYQVFHKITNPKQTNEIYFIHKVYQDGYVIKYSIISNEDQILLRKYYHYELQLVY